MIGIPVTKALVNAGFEVTALVRDIEKASNIFPTGVSFVKGDLDDKASIAEALRGAEGLYINISTRPDDKENAFNPEMGGLDNLLDVAQQSSVGQVVYLSSFLARNYQGDWWVMKAKKQGIQKVKNCGIPYTIFYPSNFMENFRNGMVQGQKLTLIGHTPNKAWWIAGADFGLQVAAAFQSPKSVNREYPVQGPEGWNMEEAAQVYVKNYARQDLTVSSMPMGLAKFLAIFIKPLRFATKLMDVMGNNRETFDAQPTWDELGKPAITIAQFAKN